VRLETLGFEIVCDYVAGKQDWLAFGLPVEGRLSLVPTIGRLSHRDVPLCYPSEKIRDIQRRLNINEWDTCVVVSAASVVLGLLHKTSCQSADPDMPVEQLMEHGPSTFRPHVKTEEMATHMDKNNLNTTLVTTPDGKLVGLLHRNDLK
jgi:CBS domain-containing protein